MIIGIIIAILVFGLIASLYILIRNELVFRFFNKLINMSCEYELRHLLEHHNDAFKWFCDKHSYDRMLYSLKPLKLKYWFTDEEIKEINS